MIEFRKAEQKDVPKLIEVRKMQLIDEGSIPDSNIDESLSEYLTKKMDDGTLVQWIAEKSNKIVATGAILFTEFPPGFSNPSGKKGYIASMYTDPAYRGQGLATKILKHLENEARERNISRLCLGASKMGHPVYKKYGFEETEVWMEMNIT